MNPEPQLWGPNDRVAVAGRRGTIDRIYSSPFGSSFVVTFDDGATEVRQLGDLEVVPVMYRYDPEPDPVIDPTRSPTENYLRLVR